jgi:hypothetical protein
MSDYEPMTVAGWDALPGIPNTAGKRIRAALQDREDNLENARLGALLTAIRKHPVSDGDPVITVRTAREMPAWRLDADGLTKCLAHLDSLVVKAPAYVSARDGIHAEHELLIQEQLAAAELDVLRAKARLMERRLANLRGRRR